ncbi:hypothetical protein QQS21_001297 [Conoideocrella luteorostrata]|uniref:Uncharacterized protein n=1 Tax=Conoideocrella luteorostrata TaxID=1105319 RepID=A0AAJ0D011_9HYPO|nr:hypothetical protein QQS21_001297 [Conoideocrella luteorostrata]
MSHDESMTGGHATERRTSGDPDSKTRIHGQMFAQNHGMLKRADLFSRAALIARDPERFETISELTADERRELKHERDNKRHYTATLWSAIFLCTIGAAIQGWVQIGSMSYKGELSMNPSMNPNMDPSMDPSQDLSKDEWTTSSFDAIIYFAAGLMSVSIRANTAVLILTD